MYYKSIYFFVKYDYQKIVVFLQSVLLNPDKPLEKQKIASMNVLTVIILLLTTTTPEPTPDAWQTIQTSAQQLTSLKAEFTQKKHLPILAKPLESKGYLYYRSPGDLRWEYVSPVKSVFLNYKGKSKRYLYRDGRFASDATANADTMQYVVEDIKHWLKGEFQHSKTLKPELTAEHPIQITLTPKNKALTKFFQYITLMFAEQPGVIKTVEIVEGKSSSTILEFSNVEVNTKLEDVIFSEP